MALPFIYSSKSEIWAVILKFNYRFLVIPFQLSSFCIVYFHHESFNPCWNCSYIDFINFIYFLSPLANTHTFFLILNKFHGWGLQFFPCFHPDPPLSLPCIGFLIWKKNKQSFNWTQHHINWFLLNFRTSPSAATTFKFCFPIRLFSSMEFITCFLMSIHPVLP